MQALVWFRNQVVLSAPPVELSFIQARADNLGRLQGPRPSEDKFAKSPFAYSDRGSQFSLGITATFLKQKVLVVIFPGIAQQPSASTAIAPGDLGSSGCCRYLESARTSDLSKLGEYGGDRLWLWQLLTRFLVLVQYVGIVQSPSSIGLHRICSAQRSLGCDVLPVRTSGCITS